MAARFAFFLLMAFAVSAAEPREQKILESALKERSPDIRREAVLALSLTGQREPFITMLESALKDKDVPVRLAAVSSLADLKTKRSLVALKGTLHDETPEVAFAGAKALLALNDLAGKAALLSVLSGDTKASSSFLSKQKRDAIRMMQTPKGMFLFAVRQGIGFAPVPGLGAGFASMQGLLSDPTVSGRATAALLLARDRDPETTEALREALTDKDWSVRAAAVHALALRDDPRVSKDLTPLLEDKKEAVQLRAAAALIRLNTIRARQTPAAKPPAAKQ